MIVGMRWEDAGHGDDIRRPQPDHGTRRRAGVWREILGGEWAAGEGSGTGTRGLPSSVSMTGSCLGT